MTALRISELVGGVIGFEDFLDPFAALDEVGFGGVIDAGAEAFVDFIGDALEMKASELVLLTDKGPAKKGAHLGVMAAGTGLGEARLIWVDGRHHHRELLAALHPREMTPRRRGRPTPGCDGA